MHLGSYCQNSLIHLATSQLARWSSLNLLCPHMAHHPEEGCVSLRQHEIWPSCFQRLHYKLKRSQRVAVKTVFETSTLHHVSVPRPMMWMRWVIHNTKILRPTLEAQELISLLKFFPFLWSLGLQ